MNFEAIECRCAVGDLVIINWEDSSHRVSWMEEDALIADYNDTPVAVTSVGWIIFMNDSRIIMGGCRIDSKVKPKTHDWSRSCCIPVGCINSVLALDTHATLPRRDKEIFGNTGTTDQNTVSDCHTLTSLTNL